MDRRQIELVQQSFQHACRIEAHLAATFYAELFAIDPSLRALFSGDMIVLGQKLIATLKFVVSALDEPGAFLPAARALALRHVDYRVEARHYQTVGVALLRTLRHELGPDFTAETRAAWAAAYQLLSDAMLKAAYGQPRAASR